MLSRKIMQYSLKFSPLYGSNTLTGSYDLNPSSPWLDHCTDQTACPLPSFSLGVGEEGKNVCPAAWRLWESLYQFTGRLFLHFRWLGPQTSSTLLLQEFFEFSWMWMSNSLFPADTQIPSLLTPPPPILTIFLMVSIGMGNLGSKTGRIRTCRYRERLRLPYLTINPINKLMETSVGQLKCFRSQALVQRRKRNLFSFFPLAFVCINTIVSM